MQNKNVSPLAPKTNTNSIPSLQSNFKDMSQDVRSKLYVEGPPHKFRCNSFEKSNKSAGNKFKTPQGRTIFRSKVLQQKSNSRHGSCSTREQKEAISSLKLCDHFSNKTLKPTNASSDVEHKHSQNKQNKPMPSSVYSFGRLKCSETDVEMLCPLLVEKENLPFCNVNSVGTSKWITLTILGEKHKFLVDTGSQISLMLPKESLPFCKDVNLSVKGATGHYLNILGSINLPILIGERFIEHEMYISDTIKQNILGMDFLHGQCCTVDLGGSKLYIGDLTYPLEDMRVDCLTISPPLITSPNLRVPETISNQTAKLSVEQRVQALSLLNKFSELFDPSKLGCSRNFTHSIELTDSRPIKQMPRRVSFAQRQVIENEIADMLAKGVIEPSCSPWASPIVLVRKKDGSIRFCIDYRGLNAQTKADAFPLPNPSDIFDDLAGSKYFATIDMKSGFWQIPMLARDKEKTAFCVPGGHYQFCRMPFGLINATATFQRTMQAILSSLVGKCAHVFVDDIVVYANSMEQLLERLDSVFDKISAAGLTLNAKKCSLFQTTIELLGHIVSANGVAPNKDKISAIKSWPEPRNRKQVRSFLGTAGYYRKFMVNFAHIAAPLSRLTSAKVPWKWMDAEKNSFDSLKAALVTEPILNHFFPNRSIIIDTDASAYAIGAVLSQIDEQGNERVVAYFSRCLSRQEMNYCVTRRELLAILDSLKHWRHYVSGVKVTVRTDHSSLTWLKNFKQPEAQLARWLERLAEFDMKLEYRKGSSADNADGLSRRPCAADCKYCMNRERKDREANVNLIDMVDTEYEWCSEQDKDPTLRTVKQWVINKVVPEWETVAGETPNLKSLWSQIDVLTMKDDVLIRSFILPFGKVIEQILIPDHLKFEISQKSHDQGHFGIKRTQEAIALRFFWPKWKADVVKIVASCLHCNQRKGPHTRAALPLKRYQASEPMQRIAIDMLGPLPLTESGNKYMIVVTDYFTKWIEAIPVPNQEAATVCEALISFISRFGIPGEIHSDQGRNFEGLLVKMLCERFSINKTRTSPYRPQSDGQTERFNRTLIAALSKICNHQGNWDKLVPLICMYYRASVHSATGVTPAMLMLGRELRLPVDVVFPPVCNQNSKHSYASHVAELDKQLQLANEYARAHLRITWETMNASKLTPRKTKPLDITRAVLVFNPSLPKGQSPKLARFWRGPFEVIEVISPYLYRVRVGGRQGSQVVHRSHIFQPPTPPQENVYL
jgi:hypothetical protein